MYTVVVALVGFIAGVVVCRIYSASFEADGTLKIDNSNPDKDIYRFEIERLGDLDKKKRIVLHIEHNADLSQK